METIEYRTIDKSKWPRGPWDNEPDKRQWPDPETGLPCLLRRVKGMGHLCGYVGVPEGHPAYGVSFTDSELGEMSVHGGLTFSKACSPGSEAESICHLPGDGESDKVWWLGFDAGHAFDIIPGHAPIMPDIGHDDEGEYCTAEYMVEQCRLLAAQLKAMEVYRGV